MPWSGCRSVLGSIVPKPYIFISRSSKALAVVLLVVHFLSFDFLDISRRLRLALQVSRRRVAEPLPHRANLFRGIILCCVQFLSMLCYHSCKFHYSLLQVLQAPMNLIHWVVTVVVLNFIEFTIS